MTRIQIGITRRRGDAKKIFHHEDREEHEENIDAINMIYRICSTPLGSDRIQDIGGRI
jgi:hypothetical protein